MSIGEPAKVDAKFIVSDDETICITCEKPKFIPAIRELKRCDECWDEIMAKDEEKKKQVALEKKWDKLRIPKRYWNFDCAALEIPEQLFDGYCKGWQSLFICGENGTGKTNLMCQILFRRNGLYFSVPEIMEMKADQVRGIQDYKCIGIDDLTKVDVKGYRMERLFDLIDYRYKNMKETIITADKSLDEIEKLFTNQWGQAISSRLFEWMDIVTLTHKWREKTK